MRFKHSALTPVLAASALLGACAESNEPAGPSDQSGWSQLGRQDSLQSWFAMSSPAVLALPGTVFSDKDEANSRLVIGVENAAAIPRVRDAMARLRIPGAAVAVEVTPPIHQVATLRGRGRPTTGGTQINFTQFLCTLGFNASRGSQRSFVTNSHCTATQGGVEGTQYFQPTRTKDPTVIAVEVADPQYFQGGACPAGRRCRYSDASRARYRAGVTSDRGAISRTSGPNNGSLRVTGTLTITAQDNTTTRFPLGTVVNKIGRTTGWTRGRITRTCVNVNVTGTNITQLCQSFVQDPGGAEVVDAGDSGSNVFQIISGNNVRLLGILWGGSADNRTFVFSPLKQIRDELGALTATN